MFTIYPYKVGSASVKKLKTALDGLIIKTEGSRYRYKTRHKVINWGNSRRPSWMTRDVPVLNKPEDVAITSNKLLTLEKLSGDGVPTVHYTEEKELAEDWLNEGRKVFVRHSLTGHSGDGIEVVEPNENLEQGRLQDIADDLRSLGHDTIAVSVENEIIFESAELPDAPLYTMGINNNGEYRVHVFNEEVILYQKKSRRVNDEGVVETAEGEDDDVRNLASNWVYRTGDLRRLERIEELAINAVQALGLDFGAVDIIKDENGEVFVLEVNSAPGISNTETCDAYTRAFLSLV